MRQNGFDDRHTDQSAHHPVLQRAVRCLLDHELQQGMTGLEVEEGFGDAIDQEAMLIDGGQYSDRDAPALWRRRTGVATGEPTKSCFDQDSQAGKSIALRRWDDAVAV